MTGALRQPPHPGPLPEGEEDPASRLDHLEAAFEAQEGELHAFLPEPGRFERLRRELEALEARWPRPDERPALFGLPVGVKDVFRVDGFETRAGSRLPAELFAGPEASSVAALRRAGALVLGKTVSTEFAYFAPGPTHNPHDPGRTPGGSSSGSAAAVAAGLAPLALGTQTIGSIGRPAAFCGVVGFKPSFGRVPTDGVVPLSPSLDHVGSFTPDAAAARRAASVLCPGWRNVGTPAVPTFAVPTGPYLGRLEAEGAAHFGAVLERLRRRGYVVREVAAMPDFAAIAERHRRLVAADAALVHAEWYARYRDRYDARTAELIERGRSVTERQRQEDAAGRERLRQELEALLDGSGADLWVSPPALGPAPLGLHSTGDPIMNLPWTHAGLPTIVLPAGTGPSGMPLGIQVAARFGADETLCAWGEEIGDRLFNSGTGGVDGTGDL